MNENKHISVLLDEAIEMLNINPDGIYVDCTLGGGGHASLILSKLKNGHLYAFDQDQLAIDIGSTTLSKVGTNFTIIKSNFKNLIDELQKQNINVVDGIIYDLGVSSFQFDLPHRGFSYRFDGPLDMRMNQEQIISAYDIINNYSLKELERIFKIYGEEPNAYYIAKKILAVREKKPIETTLELVETIKSALPAAVLRKTGHPAKQVFQAIRIEVNNELSILRKALEDGLRSLNINGRMVVITFHSLEDRIVKNIFKEQTKLQLPKGLPYVPEGYNINYRLLNNRVIVPSETEVINNPRCKSAKMRGIERIN